jgi:hypothetical protein
MDKTVNDLCAFAMIAASQIDIRKAQRHKGAKAQRGMRYEKALGSRH